MSACNTSGVSTFGKEGGNTLGTTKLLRVRQTGHVMLAFRRQLPMSLDMVEPLQP